MLPKIRLMLRGGPSPAYDSRSTVSHSFLPNHKKTGASATPFPHKRWLRRAWWPGWLVTVLFACSSALPLVATTPFPVPTSTPPPEPATAVIGVQTRPTGTPVLSAYAPLSTLAPTPHVFSTSTPLPTTLPTDVPATATPAVTPDPTLVAQEHYCEIASPPAHLPLPIVGGVSVPTPSGPSVTLQTQGGPMRTGMQPAPDVTALHVAVVDEESGSLLYARDPFARVPPASITKIVTTSVALERQPNINTVYTTTVSATALVACDGSSVMGLEPGDHVRLETLLNGMMLPSGNDAAEQVAVLLAGSRQTYVDWMNQWVQRLGLRDTHFVTPSGMDANDHYSSAYDMAMLARAAMRNPEFRTLAQTQSFVGDQYYMHNLNGLLAAYPGADGVKIGYTDNAGRTIVASATRDGHRVYVALMHSANLNGDATKLLDWAWSNFTWGT